MLNQNHLMLEWWEDLRPQSASYERMDRPVINKLRKWHFLLLGCTLILISVFLWYWDWRSLGIPSPLKAEHCITIAALLLGFVVLGIFIYRLTLRQATIMLVGMIVVNLLAALVSLWIFKTYPTFFEWLRPTSISEYDAGYVTDWLDYFLAPALYAVHIGMLLLWAESLVMFLIRKPSDRPE